MILENTTRIAAPPDVVWAVTEDVERWPEWTPTMESVTRVDTGPFDVGSTARIKQPGLPEAVWRVSELVRGERFTWATRVRGIRFRGTHEVHPEEGGTRSVLRVEASGFKAVLFWPLLRPALRRALVQENAGLKARCEAEAES